MAKKKLTAMDKRYSIELEKLYKLAIKYKDVPTAFGLLEKIRNFGLYCSRPDGEKKKGK